MGEKSLLLYKIMKFTLPKDVWDIEPLRQIPRIRYLKLMLIYLVFIPSMTFFYSLIMGPANKNCLQCGLWIITLELILAVCLFVWKSRNPRWWTKMDAIQTSLHNYYFNYYSCPNSWRYTEGGREKPHPPVLEDTKSPVWIGYKRISRWPT